MLFGYCVKNWVLKFDFQDQPEDAVTFKKCQAFRLHLWILIVFHKTFKVLNLFVLEVDMGNLSW